jgi:hypothetical protein
MFSGLWKTYFYNKKIYDPEIIFVLENPNLVQILLALNIFFFKFYAKFNSFYGIDIPEDPAKGPPDGSCFFIFSGPWIPRSFRLAIFFEFFRVNINKILYINFNNQCQKLYLKIFFWGNINGSENIVKNPILANIVKIFSLNENILTPKKVKK